MDRKMTFRGGLPYQPDVRALEEAFSELNEGEEILYEAIEGILKCSRTSCRFDGVITSWRHRLIRERDIDTKRTGTGVRILFPHERMEEADADILSGFRKAKRGGKRFCATPFNRLDEIGRKKFDHKMLTVARIGLILDGMKKELKLDLPAAKSLPKPKLVQAS